MPDEGEAVEHHWPLFEVPWKVYVDLQVDGLRREHEALRERHLSDLGALSREVAELRHRIEILGERQLSREVFEHQHEDLSKRVDALAQIVSSSSGENIGVRATIAIGLSLTILLVSIITYIIDKAFK